MSKIVPEFADTIFRKGEGMNEERKQREEEFTAWLAHPITRDVFGVFGKMAERCKEMWWKRSWESGECDPRMLADLRGRFEAVEDMISIDFERFEDVREVEGVEHKRD